MTHNVSVGMLSLTQLQLLRCVLVVSPCHMTEPVQSSFYRSWGHCMHLKFGRLGHSAMIDVSVA